MHTCWIVKRPHAADSKDIDSINSSYLDAYWRVAAKYADGVVHWFRDASDASYCRCTIAYAPDQEETWELEEVSLLTTLTVTFYEIPSLTDFAFTLRITKDWIEIHGTYTQAGGEQADERIILAAEEFDNWVRTDPMFHAADYQGMLDYAVSVHQAPKWFKKFRVR